MKKHIYLVVILTLIFSSCSTENEEPFPVNAQPDYPAGSIFGVKGPTIVVEVTNSKTGKIWMDRNLGASRVATSSTDVESRGDLYQWGRRADGHQLKNSAIISALSSIDQPGNGSFIITKNNPFDWRVPQNANLWQGVNGINNPCPTGYRIPTEAEWNAERLSWSSQNANGAFSSPLKLTMAGYRQLEFGFVEEDQTVEEGKAVYWSSTVSNTKSNIIVFGSDYSVTEPFERAFGLSVRCIKD